ncbi:hypothetical protein WJX75_003363 [Coccomyxa subellipsoidea]|uniref:Uncharacterized protein n=1 Tax=Coccomyxa subellipsoidea TaxID=248742 RepID=A0ABR2Z3F9_9CHLO
MGIINGSCWLPYQETIFVTPSFLGLWLTDIPNNGKRSKGYSPAQSMGMRIGREVGLLVCKEVSKLWAAAAA